LRTAFFLLDIVSAIILHMSVGKRLPSACCLKHVLALFSFIFVIWAVYRYFPGVLSAEAEELLLKPIVWLIPTFWLVFKVEKKGLGSLSITKRNLFPSVYWGLGLGMVFALEGLLTNVFKYRGLNLATAGLQADDFLRLFAISLVTAFCEETVFRGYIFNRLWKIWKNEWRANVVSALLFVVIHLPIGVFSLGYTPGVMVVYLTFIFIYGFGAAFVLARSGNLVSPVILHALWSWPIVLFR